jgi:hypothetical protein
MLRRDDLRHESGLVHCHLVHGADVYVLLRFDGAALCAMTARFENWLLSTTSTFILKKIFSR